jgi:hypothetical protein
MTIVTIVLNAIILALARLAAGFVSWAHRRADRLVLAEMTRNFPPGSEVQIVHHGCHKLPDGARARIVRVNVEESVRDYKIQLEVPGLLPDGCDGITFVCAAALRRTP